MDVLSAIGFFTVMFILIIFLVGIVLFTVMAPWLMWLGILIAASLVAAGIAGAVEEYVRYKERTSVSTPMGARYCPYCGYPVSPYHRYCPSCGRRIN